MDDTRSGAIALKVGDKNSKKEEVLFLEASKARSWDVRQKSKS